MGICANFTSGKGCQTVFSNENSSTSLCYLIIMNRSSCHRKRTILIIDNITDLTRVIGNTATRQNKVSLIKHSTSLFPNIV